MHGLGTGCRQVENGQAAMRQTNLTVPGNPAAGAIRPAMGQGVTHAIELDRFYTAP
jgi:hypothetical protein